EAKLQLSKRVLRLPEEARIKEVMTTITSEDIVAILQTVSAKHVNFDIDEDALSKSLNKLNNLSGLASVKKEINEIVKLARFYIEQGENPREKFSSHFLFLGNPGTGKTTVARLFSEIFNALGILEKGHLIETDRQGLVGSFVGQTAIKTKEIIDKAVGGTLFIDEAYTLSKEVETNDFGHEAIDALLKRMEDDRGKYIVIAAGYTGEMQRFIESNPGLKSRFTRQLNFEDYKPDELLEIGKRSFSDKGYRLDEETWTPLKNYFDKIFRGRDKYFGNARMVRNLVESTLKNHLLRIADFPPSERHEEVLKVITLEDMKDFISLPTEKANIKIDGDPVLLDQYLHELNELIGLDSVKLTLNKLVSSLKVAKLRKERGFKVLPKNLNAVFAGSRGTGKNTVAKIYGKILKEIGFLEKGHVI
ncbi:MAG: AAA family ATPase, partial [Ignavibacteria bacterium]|nr:AAA family ATPase [Ignavibacteria bacterium]